jgi:uncharacterized protein YggU (UPF0235/DUF167 family)
VPKSAVSVVAGAASRPKSVHLAGDAAGLARKLAALASR